MLAVDTRSLDGLFLRLRGFARMVTRPAGLMRTVGEGLEHQTRVRIHSEKRAPDGTPWAPWSPAYAKTRGAGHSLLKDTWAMVEGLESRSTATTATVFSRRPYAGVHQAGSKGIARDRSATKFGSLTPGGYYSIPARPFLGLSAGNVADLQGWLGPALEQLAVEALHP